MHTIIQRVRIHTFKERRLLVPSVWHYYPFAFAEGSLSEGFSMLGQNNVCGIARIAVSFVVVAIVLTSVGIRRTEVQFLAGTASCPASMAPARKKRSLKKWCQVQRVFSCLRMTSTRDLIRRNRDTRDISLSQTARVFYGEDAVDERR